MAHREHRNAVSAAARRICGSHHAADVTQDVFLTWWRRPESFDPGRGTLRSFLLALARHKAVDVVRSETARRAREARGWGCAAQVTNPDGVDDGLLRGETASRVRAALADLPAKERDAIAAAFFGRATYRGAATILGEPEGTVKSRIRSGLLRLRPALLELHDGPSGTDTDGSGGHANLKVRFPEFTPRALAALGMVSAPASPP